MSSQLRAEILKQRSTRTDIGLLFSMFALVLFVVLLHGIGLPGKNIAGRSDQVKLVFGWAELLGSLFASLVGVLSITAEYRYGTIRPTLLETPQRRRVVAAKVFASMLIGVVFGLLAATAAVGAGSAVLAARGVELRLEGSDYAWLLGGGAAAAALWASIGVGVGAIVRNQVPAVAGTCAWLLFVETVLFGDADIVGEIGRFTPGALGRAATGQEPLLAPALAVLLLAIYAAAAALAGSIATARRDVA
jgi:ABC-2 type transport system permease protein